MGLNFGGAADNWYVNFGTLGSWAMNSGKISFVVWERPISWNFDEWLFLKSNASWETTGLNHESNDSKIHLLAAASGTWLQKRSNTGFAKLNQWNFIAGVLDLDNFTDHTKSHIYAGDLAITAREVAYATTANGSGTLVDYSSEDMMLGRGVLSNTYITGDVCFAAIFTKALSLKEVIDIQEDPIRASLVIGNLKGLWLPGEKGLTLVPDLSRNGYTGAITGCVLSKDIPHLRAPIVERFPFFAAAVVDVDFSINSVMAISMAADALAEGAISIGESLGLSIDADAVGEAAFNIVANHELSFAGDAQADGSLTIAAYLALAFQGEVEGDTFVDFSINSVMAISMSAEAQAEAALGVAVQMAVQMGGISDAAAAISLGIQKGISVSAQMDVQATVSLASSMGLSSAADASAFGSLSLNHIMAISTVAQALADAGIGINCIQSISIEGSAIIFGVVTPDSRTLIIKAETRTMKVEVEDRTFKVASEDRTLKITE